MDSDFEKLAHILSSIQNICDDSVCISKSIDIKVYSSYLVFCLFVCLL